MTIVSLAIVWHSRTGAAQAMAEAVAMGAREQCDEQARVGVALLAAGQANRDELLAASGYVFICPENLGSMSGMMKEMFDRTYYPLLGRIEGRPYATVIAAGSDGRGAQAQIDRIATGWRLRRVSEPMLICLDAQTPQEILAPKIVPDSALASCRELGAAMMAGIALGVF